MQHQHGLNMTPAEEEASIKRVLRIRYNATNIEGLNLNQVKNYLVGEIEEELFYLIPTGASVQTIQRILYGKSGWDQTQIDTFELQHDPQDDADDFELYLTEAVAATLYDEYVGPRDVEKKPEKPKSRNRFPQRKLKSPRKDRSQSIEEMNLSDLDLAELKESKALHEEWAAFRLEHRETIENRLSGEDYAWLEREIPQAVKPIGLYPPAYLWESGKGSSRLLDAEITKNKKNMDRATKALKKVNKKVARYEAALSNIAHHEGRAKGDKQLGTKKQKAYAKKLEKLIKGARKRLAVEKKDQAYFQGVYDKLQERNRKLNNFLRLRSKTTRGRFSMPQEAENEFLCKRWKELGIASEPIGLETPLWILWKQGGNSQDLLRVEITRNGDRIRQAQKDTRSATKKIKSYKKAIANQMRTNSYTEEDLKDRMKSLKKKARKGDVSSILTRNSIKNSMEGIKLEQKNIEIFQDIWRSLLKRNKKLWAYINKMLFPQKKKRIATRLLTPQEAENVIFW